MEDGDTVGIVGVHPDLLAGDELPDGMGQFLRVAEVDGVRHALEQADSASPAGMFP